MFACALTNKILPSEESVLGETGHPQAFEVDMDQRTFLQLLLHRPIDAVVLLVFVRVGFLQQVVFFFPLNARWAAGFCSGELALPCLLDRFDKQANFAIAACWTELIEKLFLQLLSSFRFALKARSNMPCLNLLHSKIQRYLWVSWRNCCWYH